MPLKKSQKSLKNWTKQKWRTKSGKPSAKTGERYLPEKVSNTYQVCIDIRYKTVTTLLYVTSI